MEVGKSNNASQLAGGNYQASPEINRHPYNDVNMEDDNQNIDNYEETQLNPKGFFAETKVAACSVRVALRVRPLIGRELYESPQICVSCRPQENQLIIGKDRTFTFDQVFDIGTAQEDVFEICVKNLVLGCFSGYNATVLAYGQTGSGKTFTMGSGYTIGLKDQDLGIIPRVIKLIFDEVDKRKQKAEFIIKCTFLEIYNEELNDLLDHGAISSGSGAAAVIDRYIQKKDITIREEKNGNISVYGLKEEKVNCYEELASCLDRGSNQRSVASTLMNNSSSRSHAIFTISIEQHMIEDLYKADGPQAASAQQTAEEFMVAKFHFVDLAGSERAKRTGATGATLKEGISINKGLLALGNVISALTEDGKKGHVPYRDSKLTRILQDSLGGNSRTSMIACVSPAEINFEETLNSLKYASRARNIKNKPIVNRDPNSAQIAQLRQQIYELSRELLTCRKLLTSNNITFESNVVIPDGIENQEGGQPINSNKSEFGLGAKEIQIYEQEIKELKVDRSQKDKKLTSLQSQYDSLKEQSSQGQLELFQIQKERDIARFQLEQITQVLKRRDIFKDIMNEIHGYTGLTEKMEGMEIDDDKAQKENYDFFFGSSGPCILEEYQVKVEEQKKELAEKHQQVKTLQRDYEMLHNQTSSDAKLLEDKEKEIERLKRSVNKLQKENVSIKTDQRKGSRATAMPIASQVAHKRQSTIAPVEKKPLNPFPTLKKKPVNPLQDTSNNQWLPTELDYNIKHFNELFIENLSQSLSHVLVQKRPGTALEGQSQKLEDDKQELREEGGINVESTPIKQQQNEEDNLSEENSSSSDEEEVQEPIINNEQEVIEVIQSHEETKKQDEEMKQQLQIQEQQIDHIDGDLNEKERLLQAIKDSHNMLQNNLLEAMKNEYHKKILTLDNEIKNLEREKVESISKAGTAQQKSKLEDQYKKKMKDLEDQLSSLKQKDREQNTMSKQATQQKQKIKSLEGEIEKMKTQKVTLMRKIKEETDKHRKWKEERAREIMRIKQANIKKDREIDKLKRENKRKEILAKRKQEELSALMKKNKIDKQKQINATKDRQKKKNIDVGKIQEWIVSNTEKMLKYKELQSSLLQEQDQCKQVEYQIVEEQGQHAILSVRKEKLVIRKAQVETTNDDEELYQINEEIDELDLEMKTIQENIESLEEKLDFVNLKMSNYNSELIGLSPDDVEQLNFSEVQSIEGARACLGAFFGILLDVNVYKKQLEAELIHQQARVEELTLQVDEATKSCLASEINFQKELELTIKQNKDREELLVRIIADNYGVDVEQLMNGEDGTEQRPSHDLIRELLRSKENENGELGQQPSLQSQLSQLTKKAQQVKQEVKKNKEQQYNLSKTALSKRVAELERQKREDDKKQESLRHKYEQMNQEKDLYKRQLDNIKQKMKTLEVQDIKNQKQLATDDAPNNNYNSLQKSPRLGTQSSTTNPQQSKLNSLQDIRKERKIKKLGTASSLTANTKTQEPRVIVDEPMDEDQESSSTSPVKKGGEVRKISIPQLDMQALESNTSKVFEPASTKNQTQNDEFNVFARLSQGKGRSTLVNSSFTATQQQTQPTQQAVAATTEQIMTQGFDDDHKWKCLINKEQAHIGQVCALASVGNQLYSTSNKSLKIWDLDTMTNISDIQAHSGFIKCVEIWEDKKLLLTASDKVIMLWDLISLTNVGSLKGHKDEIKALNVTQDGSLLFSAGKGSATGGGLLLWDLRKGATPIEERERNQDIFSLASQGEYLFMGCRSHFVYPFNIKTFETIQPFEPPHFDVVTSLSIIDNTLVSGSRDKNLRCWDFSNPTNKYSDVMQAHSDWINTLETDYDKKELYSGSKDGIVKVWKIKNKKLKCMASLSSGSSSINSICKIDRQFGKMFVQGSSDKSIRMWKFKDKYMNDNSPISGDNNYDDQNPLDANMDNNEDSQEIENQLFQQQQDKREEQKGQKDEIPQKYQPVRQSFSSQSYAGSSKLQQMRRQKRLQENQKKQQKENDVYQK